MGFPATWLTVLLLSACTLLAHGQDNTQTRIPDTLLECYRNQSLRHAENRPPMTIGTFIDIVRKVEKFQRETVGIAELTTSLLHRFRLDGIERSQDVVEAEGVLPYAVKGNEFYKHRLILRYLVPSNNYQFPNESLSQVELCTLHFMLSHSIDTTQRGDEATVCGRLSNYESGNRVPRNARLRRQAEQAETEAEAAAAEQSLNSDEGKSDASEDAEKIPVPDTENGFQSSAEDGADTPDDVQKDTDGPQEAPKEDGKSDSTQKQQVEAVNGTTTGNGTRSGKFIFDDESVPYNPPQQKARNVADPETDVDIQPRATQTTTESDCPVENGVVYTKWGSVSLGSVLAGLAAGLYPQDIQLPALVQRNTPSRGLPKELESVAIDNKFAATLVGDLAEATLEQGPKKRENIKIGLTGGWNSTIFPRWYFNKEKDGRELTDAEIRGGLDGLVLGTYIADWKQLVPSGSELKLSQLLSMYYSEDGAFGPQYRACQRKDLYAAVAPNDRMEEQTFRFAVVLDQQSISSASVDSAQVKNFAAYAVRKLSSYLPAMDDKQCTIRPNAPRDTNFQSLSLYSNVTVIIDRNWPLEDIRALIYKLASELDLGEYGSRLTVLDGKNAAAFITDAMYAVDVSTNFTESEYLAHEGGMDIPRALEQELQKSMEGLLQAEAENKLAGGRSTIILFIPQTPVTLSDNDLTIAKDKINYFRERLPDVKFLYLAPGNKDNYKELVDNPTTDIFTFSTLATEADKINIIGQVIDRIKQVPLRLLNPTCGAEWKREDYGTADFVHSVKSLGVKYHRLHPNYFYDAGSAQVTVLGSNSQDLTVCYSRKFEYPDNATSDVTCKQTQSGNVEIKLENACEGSEYISQCRPLYISVRSTNPVRQASCSHDCVYPTNIEYTVRNQGLDCTAGVGHLLSNPQLILLTAAFILLVKNMSVSS